MNHSASNSWLQPDLLGIVSTFLDVGDVFSLLLTAGDAEARAVVKKKYLRRNFRFLEKSVMTEKVRFFDRVISFSNNFIDNWMDANSDNWKSIYSERNDGMSKADARVFDMYFDHIYGAVQLGRSEIVEQMIEKRGADPNLELYFRNNSWSEETSALDCRPLLLAALHPSRFRCLRYLLERDDVERNFDFLIDETFLSVVTEFAAVEALEICLQNGVDVNAQGTFSDTSLHTVCSMTCSTPYHLPGQDNSYPEEVPSQDTSYLEEEVQGDQIMRRIHLLLDHGADPSVQNLLGRTPRDVLEFIREQPNRWRPGVTDDLFADLIALLEKHEHAAAGQVAD